MHRKTSISCASLAFVAPAVCRFAMRMMRGIATNPKRWNGAHFAQVWCRILDGASATKMPYPSNLTRSTGMALFGNGLFYLTYRNQIGLRIKKGREDRPGSHLRRSDHMNMINIYKA
jgi:hypothetical protein